MIMKYLIYFLPHKRFIVSILSILLLFVTTEITAQGTDSINTDDTELMDSSKRDTSSFKSLIKSSRNQSSNNSEQALNLANKALTLAHSKDDTTDMARAYIRIGDLNEQSGNIGIAVENYLKAKNELQTEDQPELLKKIYDRLANIHEEYEIYDHAIKYYRKILAMDEEQNQETNLPEIHYKLGSLYYKNDQPDSALIHYKKAAQIYNEENKLNKLASVYHEMGLAYIAQQDTETAINYHNKAQKLSAQVNDSTLLAETYHTLGVIYQQLGYLKKAYKHHQKAAEIHQKLNNHSSLSASMYHLAQVHLQQGEYAKALEYARKSAHIADTTGALKYHKSALNVLASTYKKLGIHDSVEEINKRIANLKDSLTDIAERDDLQTLQVQKNIMSKEQQIRLLQTRDKLQKAQLEHEEHLIIFLIAIGIFLIILVLLFRNRVKIKENSEQLLQDKNKKLEELNERLEKLNEEKNEFLHMASHDLKNPLGSIIGLTDLIKMDDDISDEEHHEFIDMISTSAKQMLTLVKKLLDVSAIEAGNTNFDPQKIEINDLLNEVIRENRPLADSKNISLNFHTDDHENHKIFADRTAAIQVLDNFVSNAVKYSPKGKEVDIYTEWNNDYLKVAVQDEGPGLSEKDQEKLFTKFAKLSTEPTNGESSSGLGLYIVKRLVNQMNGKVYCKSKEGEGSTFIVELPTHPVDQPEPVEA